MHHDLYRAEPDALEPVVKGAPEKRSAHDDWTAQKEVGVMVVRGCVSSDVPRRPSRRDDQTGVIAGVTPPGHSVDVRKRLTRHRSSVSTIAPSYGQLNYGQPVPSDFLLIIGDREPLAWILTEQRMAFPSHRSRDAGQLAKGDRLFLYTTRGCFHSPGRGRGRIIGEAAATSEIATLKEPVRFGERSFPTGCSLDIAGLVPRGEGPEMIGLGRSNYISSPARIRNPGASDYAGCSPHSISTTLGCCTPSSLGS